jgi:ATP-dependent RNA helicase RhlE
MDPDDIGPEISPLMHFSDLDLAKPILDAIRSEGYESPTPIQAQAIPPALKGRDLLGCAQTGTGKTAAFALPILNRLHTSQPDRSIRGSRILPRALILSPTRELADQIAESFDAYGINTGLRHTVVYGGVRQFKQVRALQKGIDILVATPGRLMDLMDQGYVDLSAIEVFVLDEADRMLDMGFIKPIRTIAGEMPRKRQTLFFSATMPPAIEDLASALLHNPAKISIAPIAANVPQIDQSLYMIDSEHKPALLRHLLDDKAVTRAVVFMRTKHGADKLAKKLTREGVSTDSIHGNKSQAQRSRALNSFRSGRSRVLVATDVAARGLDVDGISHVFNFNLPNEPEAYVHRIGRTGRAGATGRAISFCAADERGFLRSIERLTGDRMPANELPSELPELTAPQRPEIRVQRDGGQGGFGGRRNDHSGRPNRSRRPGARPTAEGGRSGERTGGPRPGKKRPAGAGGKPKAARRGGNAPQGGKGAGKRG